MAHEATRIYPIDWTTLARGLIARRWLIMAVAGISAGVFAFIGLTREQRFPATVTLVVSESRLRTADAATGTAAQFRPFLFNRSNAVAVVEEFGLGDEPYALHPLMLLERVSVVEDRSAQTLDFTVRLPDPDLAAQVANRLAEMAVAQSKESSHDTITSLVTTMLEEQLERTKARVDAVRSDVTGEQDTRRGQRTEAPSSGAFPELSEPLSELVDLYSGYVNPSEAELEYQVLRGLYAELSQRLQNAEIDTVARWSHLEILDAAIAPYGPAGSPLYTRVLGGLLAGLVVGCLLAMALESQKLYTTP